jgi:hypothetical protein
MEGNWRELFKNTTLNFPAGTEGKQKVNYDKVSQPLFELDTSGIYQKHYRLS